MTYFAKEEISGLLLDQEVTLTFTYNQPPNIELQASPIGSTFGSVTVSVTASVYGEFNQVSLIKWAAGSHPVSYFNTQGVGITDHFTVQENGLYSVYVLDTAGNANVRVLEVQNIVPLSSNASLSDWQMIGLGGTIKFDFDPRTTSNAIDVSHSVYGLKMMLIAPDAYAVLYVNGLQITGNSFTNEYPLVTDKNTFEVKVKAQDGSIKTYTLVVTRLPKSSSPDSSSSPGHTSSSNQSTQGNSLVVQVNGKAVPGIATSQIDANGVKFIAILLDKDTLKQVPDALSATNQGNLSISMEDEAGKVDLRLSGEAVTLLVDRAAVITLKTKHGEYRLPLVEAVKGESSWTNDAEVQITIERGNLDAKSGLENAAKTGGFQLVGDLIYFQVNVIHHGERKEISSFNRYVEMVIYLPTDFSGTASTAVVWDGKLGVRPVPTEFTKVDGRQAAIVSSLTNSAYVLVSKTSNLADIQGHWAAAEIDDMNRRMIVNGIDGSHFAPEAVITRAELAALLARALGLPESGNPKGFRDVSESSWYSTSVAAVQAYGIMDGFKDGTFEPNREISRQEAIVTIVRALRLADADLVTSNAGPQVDLTMYADHNQIGDWANDAIRTAIREGLVKGYGDELRPKMSLTRAETTVLIYRMLLKAGLINR